MLQVGDKAPPFVAEGTSGDIDLSVLLGQRAVVLYFFPRAMTGGCTTEALEFNDLLSDFRALGTEVVGMSVDTVARQQKFRDRYGLGFDLASDHSRAVGLAYGTLKGDESTSNERDTLVIGRDGLVKLAYRRASAKGHASSVLADVQRLTDRGDL